MMDIVLMRDLKNVMWRLTHLGKQECQTSIHIFKETLVYIFETSFVFNMPSLFSAIHTSS